MPAAQRRTAAAQKAEALGETITVPFEGHDYTIPPANEWDIAVLEAQEAGALTQAVRRVLGEEQYAEFRKRHTTIGPLKEFYMKVNQAAVGEGNS